MKLTPKKLTPRVLLPAALATATVASTACSTISNMQASAREEARLSVDCETYTLPNGLQVTLHEDRSLPQVVIDTWVHVGSKDEAHRRTGFAHLFEHLMFMGTERVPDNQFDVIMESGGGSNNASTSNDRTNYFSIGPSSLLPTLLWLDADRFDALSENMTQEKLDLQREVVRNERRQTSENVPYGKASLLLPPLLFPAGHPYHHSVIGSHEDLEAATLQDVIDFFDTYYVPGNASLVVAGDFDSAEVKPLIESTFGALEARPLPQHRSAEPVALADDVYATAYDRVQFPKLILVWHSPPYMQPGDGEMDIAATILGGGPSTRLEKRLVHDERLAQEVTVYQGSRELGSVFHVEAVAAPGAELDAIKAIVLEELAAFAKEGPEPSEITRTQAELEAGFLRRVEGLFARADRMNMYLRHYGEADSFQRDLERWTGPSAGDVRTWSRRVFDGHHVDMRIFPEGEETEVAEAVAAESIEEVPAASPLDDRPDDFAASDYDPPTAESFELSNGIRVVAVPRPGTRLFSGHFIAAGGEAALEREATGAAYLAANVMNSGAGGRDAAAFADAAAALGASIDAGAGRYDVTVSVNGITSRMAETLDLFADIVLRPNMTAEDFERERALALAAIQARSDDARAIAGVTARALLFGPEHPSGRPLEGDAATVEAMGLEHLRAVVPHLVRPGAAQFVFSGDFEVPTLRDRLEERFGGWDGSTEAVARPAALRDARDGRLALVDRPGAPQTVVYLMRPVEAAEGVERAARLCIETLFGRSFTSRLNQNLREKHGYTYGAGCRLLHQADQHLLFASSSVRSDVTGAALSEFKKEFDALATGDVTQAELDKARETVKARLVEDAETTSRQAGALLTLVSAGLPLDMTEKDLAALEEVDLARINAIATSGLFDWSKLVVVLVGDRAAVLPQLAEAGFPEPELVDPTSFAQ